MLALSDVGLTEADVDFIKYFINLFMYYTADVMKVHICSYELNFCFIIVIVIIVVVCVNHEI